MTTATATRERTAAAARPRVAPARAALSRTAGFAICLLPGLLTVYFAFSSGGHGADVRALALALLALLLMAHAMLAKQPFAGLGVWSGIAGGALLVFAAWAWLSSGWSGAPASALVESQRALLYALPLIFFGSMLRRRGAVALMLRGIALAIGVVCTAALATRLYPDVFSVDPGFSAERLGYPITYWNGLGILAAVGGVLMLHLACDHRESLVVRALGAAGVPIAATTVYFTFSRGSIAAAALGVLAYLLVARPRGVVAGLIATVPLTFLALRTAYHADLLGTAENTTAAAAAQGHDVAAMLLICCAAVALCRLALGPVDTRLSSIAVSSTARDGLTAGLAVTALVVLAIAVAVDVPGRAEQAWSSFTRSEQQADARTRLTDTRVGSRSDHWDVALAYYREDRLRGAGAGSFETQWLRSRPTNGTATDAHSLYLEVLSELGLVGFALLATALTAILLGLLRRARGQRRPLYGAVFAASLMWVAHAGVDWDWELAAVSFWFFALAGAALARTVPAGDRSRATSWPFRVGAALLCLLVAMGAVRMIIATDMLDRGISAFNDGNCQLARKHVQTSLAALNTQPQAAAILGYCDAERGRYPAAINQMSIAAELDPHHWRYRYGLAVVRGLAGRDPGPKLALAARLNPYGKMATTGAAAQLARSGPAQRSRVAASAQRPVD